jgi:octaprenyl-diphosphate synthase
MEYDCVMNEKFLVRLKKIENAIRQNLPAECGGEWKAKSFGAECENIRPEHIFPLVETTRSLVDLGGKRWRPLLLVLCAEGSAKKENKISAEKNAYKISPLVEFVHTASLIHDDIEDRSEIRRGKPAAYITYGTDTAINAGSWLYFEASVCIENLDCPAEQKNRLYRTYLAELRKLHLGQAMDIAWHRDDKKIPAENEYISMVKCKTGTLSSMAAKIGTLISDADEKIVERAGKVSAEIGAGFQILDDVVNLTTGNAGKKRGDDIVEKKKSLPLIEFVRLNEKKSPEKILRLQEFLEQSSMEGIESDAVEKAIQLLEESSAIDSAQKKGIALVKNGCSELCEILGGGEEGELVKELFDSMIPCMNPQKKNFENSSGGKNV